MMVCINSITEFEVVGTAWDVEGPKEDMEKIRSNTDLRHWEAIKGRSRKTEWSGEKKFRTNIGAVQPTLSGN